MTLQQELSSKERISDQSPAGGAEENNPLNSGTEEKVPNNSNSFSEEYLHHIQNNHHPVSEIYEYHKCDNSGTYIAYHGELLVPPPNAA